MDRAKAATAELCAALTSHGRADAAIAIETEGPRSISEAARRIAERIDLPNTLKKKAHQAYMAAQALNPGEVGSACGGWAHHSPESRIKGWWTIAPQSESKVNRKL